MVLTKALSGIAQLLYPHHCAGCGRTLHDPATQVCWHCHEEMPYTGFENHADNPVARLFTGRIRLHQAFSILFFQKHAAVQNLLHHLKYKGNKEVGLQLGRLMGARLLQSGAAPGIDAIVPLPLHRRRLASRGYNQAALIARGMAEVLGLPVQEVAVLRSQYTQTQTRKGRMARWLNVEHVFDLQPGHRLEGKHVLLVDDVITTGATMEACGQVLLKIPGLKLSVASAAWACRV